MKSKHLIICCDGTWQTREQTYPTNVAKIFQAFTATPKSRAITYYDEGIGTDNFISRVLGGLFGSGLDRNIIEAYQFLCSNYSPGDHIHLFGFSRGAYTVRSVCGLIYKCGLLKTLSKKMVNAAMKLYRKRSVSPDDPEAVTFRKNYAVPNTKTGDRPVITFLGCWDTVGALGIPDLSPVLPFDKLFNDRYRFYDTKLSFIIQHARHAVSLDETRKVFNVTPMTLSRQASTTTDLKEIWFAGTHSCVGGGDQMSQALADITLQWMVENFINATGDDAPNIDSSLTPDKGKLQPEAPFDSIVSDFYKSLGLITRDGPADFNDVHWSVKRRLTNNLNYTPQALNKFSSDILALRSGVNEVVALL